MANWDKAKKRPLIFFVENIHDEDFKTELGKACKKVFGTDLTVV
jgi:hypothetical protein